MYHLVIDKERFTAARKKAEGRQKQGIGTLREKLLHATLKNYFSGEGDLLEQKVGAFVADISGQDGIVEIQTGGCAPLKKKLAALLSHTRVTVVCPIMRKKKIFWIDPISGELTGGRKSPKNGTCTEILPELFYLSEFIGKEGFRVVIFLYDGCEYRRKDGWGNDGKRGAHRYERYPEEAVDLLVLESPFDCGALLPDGCPENFTGREFSRLSSFRGRNCWAALKLLTETGVLERDSGLRPYVYHVIYKEYLKKNNDKTERTREDGKEKVQNR